MSDLIDKSPQRKKQSTSNALDETKHKIKTINSASNYIFILKERFVLPISVDEDLEFTKGAGFQITSLLKIGVNIHVRFGTHEFLIPETKGFVYAKENALCCHFCDLYIIEAFLKVRVQLTNQELEHFRKHPPGHSQEVNLSEKEKVLNFHMDCFKCFHCNKSLVEREGYVINKWIFCSDDILVLVNKLVNNNDDKAKANTEENILLRPSSEQKVNGNGLDESKIQNSSFEEKKGGSNVDNKKEEAEPDLETNLHLKTAESTTSKSVKKDSIYLMKALEKIPEINQLENNNVDPEILSKTILQNLKVKRETTTDDKIKEMSDTPPALPNDNLPPNSSSGRSTAAPQPPVPSTPPSPHKTTHLHTQSSLNKEEESELTNLSSSSVCFACRSPIDLASGQTLTKALSHVYHTSCFVCASCHLPFPESVFIPYNEEPYCEPCYKKAIESTLPKCLVCGGSIFSSYITRDQGKIHVECFVCAYDSLPIIDGSNTTGKYKMHEGKTYCEKHFLELFSEKCVKCGEGIIGRFVKMEKGKIHEGCFRCEGCGGALVEKGVSVAGKKEGRLVCPECAMKMQKR